MAIGIRPWHALVALVLVVVCGVGLAVAAGREKSEDETWPLDSSLLPTSTAVPTVTLGWWGTVVFGTPTITATVTITPTLVATVTITPALTATVVITPAVTATIAPTRPPVAMQ